MFEAIINMGLRGHEHASVEGFARALGLWEVFRRALELWRPLEAFLGACWASFAGAITKTTKSDTIRIWASWASSSDASSKATNDFHRFGCFHHELAHPEPPLEMDR